MYTLKGVSIVANFITAYEYSQENRDSHFLICNVFLFLQTIFLTFIFQSTWSYINNCRFHAVYF